MTILAIWSLDIYSAIRWDHKVLMSRYGRGFGGLEYRMERSSKSGNAKSLAHALSQLAILGKYVYSLHTYTIGYDRHHAAPLLGHPSVLSPSLSR